jgi:hypothetical protein
MFKIRFTEILFLLLASATTYTQAQTANFDYGKVENNKYINAYFNFEMPVPSNWFIQSKEATKNMMETGKKMVAGDDENLQAVFDASEINSAFLLTVFKYEQGAAVEFNPSISIIAENLKNYSGIKSGADYLFHTSRILAQSQVKYEHIDKEFVKEVINGTDFYTMHAEMNFMGQNIKQIYYSAIIKGFSFDVIISYADEDQKNELLSLINAMKFSD